MLHRRRQLAQLIVRSRRGAEALPYGVAVVDRKYRLDWCNEAARLHLGLDPVRDRGQPIGNFVREPEFVEYQKRVLETWELENMLDLAEATTLSALNRTESRGGHARDDYPQRDDVNWHKHTLCWADEAGKTRIDYRPVNLQPMSNDVQSFPPKARVY